MTRSQVKSYLELDKIKEKNSQSINSNENIEDIDNKKDINSRS